jgi:UDP-glucuronate 4-epimerase
VIKKLEPLQLGDVEASAADATALETWVGFRPATQLAVGVVCFDSCYRRYAV